LLLAHPLSGSTTWIELNGTVTVRKIWDGRANLDEIESSNATTHFQGLTLFLYNPASHQWSQTFANIDDGTLGQPLIGEFKNGRGVFQSGAIPWTSHSGAICLVQHHTRFASCGTVVLR
jgi:hypothetical protein